MAHFYWEGSDKNGSEHQGAAESQNLVEAKERLQQDGFYRIRFWKIHQSSLNKVLGNTEVTEFLLQLHETYSMVPFFSPMFVKLVALGESSGPLSSSFARIGIQNQESLKKIMGWVNTLIEPVLLIFIAVGVLGFLLSMYIPLFRMAEQF